MKMILRRAAAPAALIFAAATVAALPATAGDTQDKPSAKHEHAETAKGDDQAAPIVIPEIKEDKRICRRVKLDMSSRRATKVCKTSDEWREFNQQR